MKILPHVEWHVEYPDHASGSILSIVFLFSTFPRHRPLFFFFPNITSFSGDYFISDAITTHMGKPQQYTEAAIFHRPPSVNGVGLHGEWAKGHGKDGLHSWMPPDY